MNAVNRLAPALQEVTVKIIAPEVCKRQDWYGRYGDSFEEQSMMCAGYEEGGKDSCDGDSGGPLQCMTPSGRWKLAGVASFGVRKCGMAKRPGVYVDIAKHMDWIERHFKGIYASITCRLCSVLN